MDDLRQRLGVLQTQLMPRGQIQVQFARRGVDPEQIVDPLHHADGCLIAGVEFGRLEKLPPRMCPTCRMHQQRPAHMIVSDVAVGL